MSEGNRYYYYYYCRQEICSGDADNGFY